LLAIAALSSPEKVLQCDRKFRSVANVQIRQLLAFLYHLASKVHVELLDTGLLTRGDLSLPGLVEFHGTIRVDLLDERLVLDLRGLDSSQHHAVRRQLHSAHGSRWQRLRFARAFLSLGQVHVTDRALLAWLVPDDVRVHRTEVFDQSTGSLCLARR